jgi:hypothetical protein
MLGTLNATSKRFTVRPPSPAQWYLASATEEGFLDGII